MKTKITIAGVTSYEVMEVHIEAGRNQCYVVIKIVDSQAGTESKPIKIQFDISDLDCLMIEK